MHCLLLPFCLGRPSFCTAMRGSWTSKSKLPFYWLEKSEDRDGGGQGGWKVRVEILGGREG